MSRDLVWLLISAGLLAAALIGGRRVLAEMPFTMPPARKLLRLAVGLVGGFAVFLAAGAFLLAPPEKRPDSAWLTSLEQGFKQSAATGKPLLVDAWATWCTSCVEMKKKTFPDPAVEKELNRYVTVALDMDAAENEAVWDRYGIGGLPWIAVFEPGKPDTPVWVLTDAEGPEAFAKRLAGSRDREEGIGDWLAGKGLLLTLLLVFLGGILASLTPCAYPSYLLVFGFFSGPDAGPDEPKRGRGQALVTALALVLGMASSYSAGGMLAAMGGGAVGRLMTNPWVMGGIAALFLVMGASSLSVLPPMEFARLKGAIHSKSKATLAWAFVFGLVMGLIVAPCVGPLLIGILAYIASTGDLALGALLMVTFALGMGVLFFVLALFSQTIRARLRMGTWSELITVAFGILFIAAAFYYLKGVVDYESFFALL
jgi:thiol:disulfide interchange protein